VDVSGILADEVALEVFFPWSGAFGKGSEDAKGSDEYR